MQFGVLWIVVVMMLHLSCGVIVGYLVNLSKLLYASAYLGDSKRHFLVYDSALNGIQRKFQFPKPETSAHLNNIDTEIHWKIAYGAVEHLNISNM